MRLGQKQIVLNEPGLLAILRVAEMAPVAVRATPGTADHAAKLSLVSRMTYNRTKFIDAVSELALISVGTPPHLLPLVAELGLGHSLVEYLH